MQVWLSRRWWLLTAVLVTGLGFGVRLHNLTGDSLWLDEMLTLRAIALGWGEMMSQPDHPPLMYLLTAVPVRAMGETKLATRLVSLLAGTLAMPVMLQLGKRTGQPASGVLAALLLALAPLHLRHSQEGRHYALLLLFSALSFLFLYLGMHRQQRRHWLAFVLATTLNLYTHYGAFVVLLAQSVLVTIWQANEWRQQRWRSWWLPAQSFGLILLLYLPQLPRLLAAAASNVGSGGSVGLSGAQIVADLRVWFWALWPVFGTEERPLALLLLLLCLLGLVALAWQQKWLLLLWLGGALLFPFLLLAIVPITREPYPRYAIYLLPFFLLAVAVGLMFLLSQLPRPGLRQGGVGMTMVAIGLLFWQPVQREYAYVLNDWEGILAQVEQQAAAGDMVLALTQSFDNGYNIAGDSLNFYLNGRYPLLYGHGGISYETAVSLAKQTGRVWAVSMNWTDPPHSNAIREVETFQSDILLLHNRALAPTILADAISLYEQLVPHSHYPLPRCLHQQDLLTLYLAAGEADAAYKLLNGIEAQCGDVRQAMAAQPELEQRWLALFAAEADVVAVRDVAARLLAREEENELALDLLTAVNLWHQFETETAVVAQNGAPEPVRKRPFALPGSDPVDNVLLLHPPAAISFSLDLPAEPVILWSRLAMLPDSWAWGGDGSTFVVSVTTADGTTTELHRQHISNEAADQTWHPLAVSLAPYAGHHITLTLHGEAGPTGDTIGDWAGWQQPRLLWAQAPSGSLPPN